MPEEQLSNWCASCGKFCCQLCGHCGHSHSSCTNPDPSKLQLAVAGEDLEKHLVRKLQELYLSDSVSTVSQARPNAIRKP